MPLRPSDLWEMPWALDHLRVRFSIHIRLGSRRLHFRQWNRPRNDRARVAGGNAVPADELVRRQLHHASASTSNVD
jgi:hypothetical protein